MSSDNILAQYDAPVSSDSSDVDTIHEIDQNYFPWIVHEPIKIKGEIPVSLSIENGDRFLFISYDQRLLTHGIHKYPAKFFPELPRWIIKRYSQKGNMLLDPFMGSGTTNLEASILGRHSIGVDVDPFSRFLSSAKTTVLPGKALASAWQSLRKRVTSYSEPPHFNGVPEFPYRDNWFKPYILKELAHIKLEIKKLDSSPDIKNFFLVCFSSIIRQVSEADNNCTRTVIRKKLNKQVLPNMAINLFIKRTEVQVEKMYLLSVLNPPGRVLIPDNADARNMQQVKDESIDLALTSPPYANAVDYPRTHQLEIYWLGFASGSLQPLKKHHVGTEVVQATDYSILHKTGCRKADATIAKIYEIDPRRAYIVTKYLNDMYANLREVYRVLKPGSVYALVVGNNLIRKVEFETWRYLCSEAPKIGYTVECHFVSAIINHFIKVPRKERINDDHVLILRK